MARRRQPPTDPLFAAEIEAIAAAHRQAEHDRTGCGRPVDDLGQPAESWPNMHAGDQCAPAQELRSTFRPGGDAR